MKNEDDNENDNKNKDKVNRMRFDFLNFLNFSALCRLIKDFDSKSKLKFTL